MGKRTEYFRKYAKSKHGKEVRQNCNYKCLYGITTKDYDAIYKKQNGCCAICERHQSEFDRRLCVDHDHETGKVRGLLCTKCNVSLGWYELFKQEVNTYLEVR